MKDSVSSSWRSREEDITRSWRLKEITASRPHGLAPTPSCRERPHPSLPLLSRDRAQVSPYSLTSFPASPAPVSPASACPRFPAAGRTPPAGVSSLRGSHFQYFVSACVPSRLPSLSHPLPPLAPPRSALVVPYWERQAEVILPGAQ